MLVADREIEVAVNYISKVLYGCTLLHHLLRMAATPLFVISGPSGSGKNSIISELQKRRDDLQHSISSTTRLPRKNEQHGIDYYFLTKDTFERAINENAFIEYVQILGNYYGTSRVEIERIINLGKIPILDIDVQGALQIRKSGLPTRLVFLAPPSLDVLKQRLINRKTETPAQIEQRLKLAKSEIQQQHLYDTVIVNNNLTEAADQFDRYITEQLPL